MGTAVKKASGNVQQENIDLIVDNSLKNKDSFNRIVYLILGGRDFLPKEPGSPIEYVIASWRGIPKISVNNLSSILDITMKDMAALLNVSPKTLSRKGKRDLLDPLESSLSIELANVSAKGISVFEDSEKFKRWLQKENRALSGKKPIDLLNTPTGIKLVSQVLERIQEGVYS